MQQSNAGEFGSVTRSMLRAYYSAIRADTTRNVARITKAGFEKQGASWMQCLEVMLLRRFPLLSDSMITQIHCVYHWSLEGEQKSINQSKPARIRIEGSDLLTRKSRHDTLSDTLHKLHERQQAQASDDKASRPPSRVLRSNPDPSSEYLYVPLLLLLSQRLGILTRVAAGFLLK